MINILKTIHNWGGFLIIIPLFLTCFTGGILGVSDLLSRSDNKGQAYVPMSPQEKSSMYANLLENDIEFMRFRTPQESRPFASAFSRGHTKYYSRNMLLIDERLRDDRPVMNGIFFFHRHFLMGKNGSTINGIVSLLAVLFILIGLYLWWNKYRRLPLKKAWPKSIKSRDLFNSHILAGVVIALPFVILTYTGFHLVFGNDIFGRDNNTLAEDSNIVFATDDIETLINEAQAFWPEKDLVSVSRVVERVSHIKKPSNEKGKSREIHKGKGQSAGDRQFTLNDSIKDKQNSIKGESNRSRRSQMLMTGLELRFTSNSVFSPQGSDTLKIDLRSGKVLHKTVFTDLPLSEKLKAYVRPLHDGLNLPALYVVFVTMTSFIASFILFFGAYTFAKRIAFAKLRKLSL